MDDDAPGSRLHRWLNDPAHPDRSQERLGKVLGVTQAAVSAWARNKSRPDIDLRGPLATLTGIAADDWHTDEERERIDRVRLSVRQEAARARKAAA